MSSGSTRTWWHRARARAEARTRPLLWNSWASVEKIRTPWASSRRTAPSPSPSPQARSSPARRGPLAGCAACSIHCVVEDADDAEQPHEVPDPVARRKPLEALADGPERAEVLALRGRRRREGRYARDGEPRQESSWFAPTSGGGLNKPCVARAGVSATLLAEVGQLARAPGCAARATQLLLCVVDPTPSAHRAGAAAAISQSRRFLGKGSAVGILVNTEPASPGIARPLEYLSEYSVGITRALSRNSYPVM